MVPEAARLLHVITHPEVAVDPAVPVIDWGLSPSGTERLHGLLQQPWLADVRAVFSSAERKALETARPIADAVGVQLVVADDLGENDRSATGFLPPEEFERVADEFFAHPTRSVRGWETAAAAQERVHAAVLRCLALAPEGDVAVVAHGAVGTLLWCRLQGQPIDRRFDQPGQGSCYAVDLSDMRPLSSWRRIPAAQASP